MLNKSGGTRLLSQSRACFRIQQLILFADPLVSANNDSEKIAILLYHITGFRRVRRYTTKVVSSFFMPQNRILKNVACMKAT